MFQLHPKNTFLLIGKTNSGKSHFVKLIEKCIPFVRRNVKDSVFSWSQLRYGNVGLWEEPTTTQDDVDSTKLILEGAKTPIAIKGKDPFIPEKRTPIFVTNNTEIHQHVSSQADALASRYFRYEFETEILRYPFCNQKHVIALQTLNGSKRLKRQRLFTCPNPTQSLRQSTSISKRDRDV
jgi:energy-coupling factor transporter ATP-binding protein EcfA2